MNDNAYIHGYSIPERARLVEQAAVLAPAVFGGLNLDDDQHLLEIGCGVGAETKHLLQRWPQLRIHSIDLSEQHLAAAADYLRDEIKDGRVQLTQMNAEQLSFADDQFDLAMTIWVLEHVPDVEKILRETLRVLRPGGRIILSEVDNDSFRFYPENPVIQRWWDAFNRFQQSCGADPFVGQRLEGLARQAGFENIQIEPIHVVSSRREPERRLELLRYDRDLLLSGAENMKQAGYVNEQQEQALREEFERLEQMPEVDFEYLAVRLTATKPDGR